MLQLQKKGTKGTRGRKCTRDRRVTIAEEGATKTREEGVELTQRKALFKTVCKV